MVKKLQAMADAKSDKDNQLAGAVRESAQQIWLAGLGAFAKAQQEGTKVFEALVREGNVLQRRTRAATEERIGDVTGRMTKAAGQISKQATESWDRLEQVFEDRVARALTRLGVPSARDMQDLKSTLETLAANVAALGGKTARPARTARPVRAARTAAAKAAASSAAPSDAKPAVTAKTRTAKTPTAKAAAPATRRPRAAKKAA
ncbi:MAG: phasin family protein [Lautropia sp.]